MISSSIVTGVLVSIASLMILYVFANNLRKRDASDLPFGILLFVILAVSSVAASLECFGINF